ncbi:MAG: MATE family efflux transporter [Ruminiclostridium sp.]|jgi:putative MATE family efflux protein|nr:MATE family efflux transporter [Ruminiclostridium sp.]
MTQSTDTRAKLLTAPPFQLMLSLSIPAIIGMVVVGLYNFMDRVFVGQLINEVAMGAVSVSYPFTLINTGVSTLIGVGSASVLSRAIGKKDQNTVDMIMGNLIAMNLLLGAVITVLGMIFTRQLLSLSGAEGEILNHAERYLHIIFVGSLFVNFAQSANMIMRGEGILKRAMLITGTGAVLNIILDPIMITVMSTQNKGIEGAAYATVTSQIVTAAITLWYFLTKSKVVRIHRIRLETSLFSEILGVGFSAMLMQVMTMVQQTTLYHVAARHGGDTWQIILGAALSIQSFTMIPLWGAGQGFQPAAGTNYGAKQYDRVKQITRAFMMGVTVLSLIFYIPMQLAPKTILSWFIKDAEIAGQGVTDFLILFSTYIVLGFVLLVITLMQSLGKATKASVLVLMRQIILFLPLTILLPQIGGLGVHGVFLAPAVTDLTIFVLAIVMLTGEFRGLSRLATKKKLEEGFN